MGENGTHSDPDADVSPRALKTRIKAELESNLEYYDDALELVYEDRKAVVYEDPELSEIPRLAGKYFDHVPSAVLDVVREQFREQAGEISEKLTDLQGDVLVVEKDEHARFIEGRLMRRLADKIEGAGSAAQGVDQFATERMGYSPSEWGELTGRTRQVVRKNAERGADADT